MWHRLAYHHTTIPRSGVLQSPKHVVYNSMLRLGKIQNERLVIRNAFQVTQSGALGIIYDTGAAMTMITDHGSGYMTNKRSTPHEATGCLNENPKGGLHAADFSFLLQMDDTNEGFNRWFNIVAP